MGIGSILLGVASLLFMFGGFLFTPVPVLGTILSFAAPILAIAGIVVGGIGMSRGKRDGQPTGTALAGIIVSGVALIPALVVAVTCGLCNALCTANVMDPQNRQNNQWWVDGGAAGFQVGTPRFGVDAGTRIGVPDPGGPGVDPNAPGVPPPAFPPPPMPDPGQPLVPGQPADPGTGGSGSGATPAQPGAP